MTLTETTPATTEPAPTSLAPAVTGFAALLGSGDHKTVGRLYLVTSLLFLLVAGVVGGLLGIERIDTGGFEVLDRDVFQQVFTLHSVAGVFLFLLPLLIGVATAIVPLQVGASTIAFPRAASAAFWTYLISGGLVLAAYAIDGGPFGTDPDGIGLFLVALGAVLVALTVATVCVMTTVVALRAPGMHLLRVPLFAWSNLVAGAVWLLTLPVLAGILVILYLDHRYFPSPDFLGGADGIYGRLTWVFGQPSVYLFAIPVLGLIGDVVPVFGQVRHRQHRIAAFAIAVFGVLSVGAWAQSSFDLTADSVAQPYLDEGPWMVLGPLAVLPLLVLGGLWALTLRQGRPRLGSPLLYAVAAFLMLLVGALVGAAATIPELDLADTTWASAQIHYVVLAATIGLLGGITYWAPKLFGRLLSETTSRLAAVVLLVGTVLLAFPEVISGALDQNRGLAGVADTDRLDAVEALNLVSAIGGGVVLLGVLLFLGVLAGAAFGKAEAPGDDPWDGHTLEWATTSPPVVGNFATLPEISSEAPLYDARHATTDATPED